MSQCKHETPGIDNEDERAIFYCILEAGHVGAHEYDEEFRPAPSVSGATTPSTPHEHKCNRPDEEDHSTCVCDCGAACFNTTGEPEWIEPFDPEDEPNPPPTREAVASPERCPKTHPAFEHGQCVYRPGHPGRCSMEAPTWDPWHWQHEPAVAAESGEQAPPPPSLTMRQIIARSFQGGAEWYRLNPTDLIQRFIDASYAFADEQIPRIDRMLPVGPGVGPGFAHLPPVARSSEGTTPDPHEEDRAPFLSAYQVEKLVESLGVASPGFPIAVQLWDEITRYRMLVRSLRDRLATAEKERDAAKEALGEAAREINCAGPVAHRIRVLRQEHAATVARLTEENDRLRSLEALHAKQADAANGEVARLTAEKQALEAALDAYLASLRSSREDG